MPDKNQHIAAARKVYETYWESYSKGDLETFVSTLDETYEMIGTSEKEICHTKADGIEFLKAQIAEIVGKAELRNRQIDVLPVNQQMLVNEHSDIYVLADSTWNFYSKIRISTLLRETETGWKVFQQHGSLPDIRVQEGETMAIDKISRENIELRDAVKRRTAELEHKNWELEIEATLERVRTMAMGMKKPDDLLDVCRIISEQLNLLKIGNIRNVQVAIIDEPKKIYANYQYFSAYAKSVFEETVYTDNEASNAMVTAMQKSANSFFIGSIKEDELQKFRDWRKEYGQFPDPILDDLPEVFYYFYSIGQGGLGLTTYQAINENELEIFKRFHLVFKLAYRRFMDIQQAEAQAREAQIETALERIRSRALSMHKSDEVGDVSDLLFSELEKMNINPTGFSIMVFDREQDKYELWRAKEVAHQGVYETFSIKAMYDKLDMHIPGFTEELESEWNSGSPFFIAEFRGKKRISFLEANREMGNYTEDQFENVMRIYPDPIFWHLIFFRYGWLGLIHDEQLPAKDLLVIHRFADVFEFAHTRFLDLKKAESHALRAEKDLIAIKAARQKAEEALTELKATQDQLVQQEKLASLGQLTAGIAHEIKNPLNFVNNFSEVSTELIEEALEEIRQIEGNAHATETAEILADIKSNLSKIHEHGTRANGIVTSMLQHSRGGSGKMEPTDLNALIKEFVNLSFHGMRAGKNPINVEIQPDLDNDLGKVNLISEDFSRVVLNLVNNAFDAMREKTKTDPGYKPVLSMSTKQLEKTVEIAISDNGPGIPEEIKDKILQPFFTTKKGTEGTGLGLSITNDIVKAHGGKLNISSSPGGTIFKILLNK